MHNPLISVIVPVYNVEKYLDRCIGSIVNQTYKNLEIIIVDDGSTDSCGSKCDDWRLKDNRIKVIHQPNGGLSAARNTGLKESNGDWISFIDSDDYIESETYEEFAKEVQDDSIDIVYGNIIQEYQDGRIVESGLNWNSTTRHLATHNDLFVKLIKYEIPHSVCFAVFRKDFICNYTFSEGEINEDFFFTGHLYLEILKRKRKILYLPFAFYHYMINTDGICFKNKIRLENAITIHKFQLLKEYIRVFPEDSEALDLYTLYSNIILDKMKGFSKKSRKELKNDMVFTEWCRYISNLYLKDFRFQKKTLLYTVYFILQKYTPIFYIYMFSIFSKLKKRN